jgi:TolA-binding protein
MAYAKSTSNDEKRQYLRLDTVFPIEFQVVGREDRGPISELREGFTRNVGKGGMGIFAKTLKEQDKEFFKFVPHETKLKLIINIPLDREPIECFATVEWIERQPGPLVDTYMFGVSYDFINELEYEKIMSYVKWLRLKPKLITSLVVLLGIVVIFSSVFLFKINVRRLTSERQLKATTAESRRAVKAKEQAEKRRSLMEADLGSAKMKQLALTLAFKRLAEEKETLEKISEMSEDERRDLELQLEELSRERELLEEQIEIKTMELKEEAESLEISSEEEIVTAKISEERIRSEEANYNKFRELILNEKIQSLSAYVSTHRSSIYHTAALFALAELRYKHGGQALAEVNYNQVIEMYPMSKYALYSSHRLDQIRANDNYDGSTLKNIYTLYNLPELFDYRDIEPYVR